jgi:hypothetical protein
VIPVKFQVLPAEPDPRNLAGLEPPAEIAQFKIG